MVDGDNYGNGGGDGSRPTNHYGENYSYNNVHGREYHTLSR